MYRHEHKYCPRCNSGFECKVGSILLCQCTNVVLNESERDYIRQHFTDCLCAACMKDMRAEYHNNKLKDQISTLFRGHAAPQQENECN